MSQDNGSLPSFGLETKANVRGAPNVVPFVDSNEKNILKSEKSGSLSTGSSSLEIETASSSNPDAKNKDSLIKSLMKKRLYPEAALVSFESIAHENWHYVLDQMPIGGSGLQILLNSLASYEEQSLVIHYLSKMTHFLTENLLASLESQISEYFGDDVDYKIKIRFVETEELAKNPKQRQVELHQANLDAAYNRLINDPCVLVLQEKLGALLDKNSISLPD